jgi:phosphatidylglycerophosphate synthase
VARGPAARFLGLRIDERNRRVARRAGGIDAADAGARDLGKLPRLVVPPQAALTPRLFVLLRTLARDRHCRIVWHAAHPPLQWQAPPTGTNNTDNAVDDTGVDEMVLNEPLVLDVSSAAARHDAAWLLLRESGKPHDGWLSRHLHRRISRVFSYAFLRAGLSAHVATLFTLAIGLAGAAFMAQTSHVTMIAGGLMFWFASIADGIDGEMARLTLSESRFGEQLDAGVDQLTHLAGLTGVLIGWSRQGIGAPGVALAGAVLAGTPLMLLWAMALVRRARRTGQFFVPTKPIETAICAAARETGAPPLRATAAIFILFRREAFSCAAVLISLATAQRAAIPAAIAVGLLLVLVTFLTYGSTLLRMMRETAGPLAVDTTTTPAGRRSSVQA